MKTIKLSLAAAMAAAVATTGASANMLEEIISNPQLDIEIRPRYEYVDVSNNDRDSAKALTVRTAIGVKGGLLGVDGLNFQLQGMSVDNFGWVTDYDGKTSGNPKYEVVADPAQARMTQANISYTYEGFTGIFGRKMVVLDDARFIGNVGWRQMPQTYDLVAGIYNWEGLNLLAAYVTRVNTVVESSFATESVLLHANYTFMPELKVTVFDYMIENFADQPGIMADGTFDLNDFKIKYHAAYAAQTDPSFDSDKNAYVASTKPGIVPAKPGDLNQDASYYKLAADVMWQGLTAGMYYELLSAADKNNGVYSGNAFNTPLATLHAHNGWADMWLGTPTQGLEDLAFKLGYNFGEYGKILGVYHIFSSDDEVLLTNGQKSDDLGDEIDVAYNYQITKGLGLLLKAAWYSAGDVQSYYKNNVVDPNQEAALHDTDKYWVQLDYKFHTGF
ncbi:hypothetical protein [Hydrogenimonas sp.]